MKTVQEINIPRMYQMSCKIRCISGLCRDAELRSYIVQVIIEDVANVICSEHDKFPLYAL